MDDGKDFLFDREAVIADLATVPQWKVELLRAYGCAALWPKPAFKLTPVPPLKEDTNG